MSKLVYPETEKLLSKEDYGICYCGGGLRSCVLTYGSISGLKEIVDITKIKYISGVSGSTWFIVGYTYYNDKLIFDKYIKPEDCTLDNIKSLNNNTFGKTLDNVNIATEMIESFFDLWDRKINRWNTVVYESFFEQYGDNDITNFDITKVPYPLINSTINYNNIIDRYFPITFTPDYSSIPIKFNSNGTEYGGYNIDIKRSCENHELVPYIQSELSSAFFEAGKEKITKGRYEGTPYKLFNPNTNQINLANLIDGGMFDNSGLYSLLVRKVKNIHMNIFPNTNIRSNDFISKTHYFTSLFKGNPESDKYGIFKFGLWQEVFEQFLYKLDNGLPITVKITTDVEPNEYLQIEGYTDVNFLIHISSCSQEWFNKLPDKTKVYIEKEINNFPYIKTTKYKLNGIEINLMYSCVIHDILNSSEYKEFYSIQK